MSGSLTPAQAPGPADPPVAARFAGRPVLVTGGAGFIGSNLAIRLARAGARVTVVDAMFPELGGNLANLADARDAIRFEHGDIRDRDFVGPLVREADCVFNLAGNVSHIDSMRDPAFDHSVNSEAQMRFLECCRAEATRAVIVHTSTRQVYGAPRYLPVDEQHPIQPIDVNGINKLAGEHYHSVYHSYYGLRTVTLRLTNTYGPRQLIRHSRQGFIAWFMNRALLGEPIQLFGGGTQLRDFNYVDDVCDALCLAALVPGCVGNVYNLSGPRASLAEVGELCAELSAGRTQLERIPFPPEKKKLEIGDYYGVSTRFEQASGWLPQVGLRDGLARMFAYFREHAKHYV